MNEDRVRCLRIKYNVPMKLFCDNKSIISIALNLIQLTVTKDIEIE